MSTTTLRGDQQRATNLFKIAQQQRVAVTMIEQELEFPAACLEAAAVRSHMAMIYQAIAEVYPGWAHLWNCLATAEYDKAARHELAAYLHESAQTAA